MPRDRFIRNRQREMVRDQRSVEHERSNAALVIADHICDVDLVRSIVDHPAFDPEVGEFWIHSLEWLSENESRTNREDIRAKARSLKYVLDSASSGERLPELPPEQKAMLLAKTKLKKQARDEHFRRVRPEWMNDPGKLPKRPPAKIRKEV